nr:unnamed protein product [Digitaria exilis]
MQVGKEGADTKGSTMSARTYGRSRSRVMRIYLFGGRSNIHGRPLHNDPLQESAVGSRTLLPKRLRPWATPARSEVSLWEQDFFSSVVFCAICRLDFMGFMTHGTAAGAASPPLLEPLPLLRDVAAADRPGLLIRKLRIVAAIFDLSDSLKHPREKEAKRQALLELVDYVQAPAQAAANAPARLPDHVQEALVAAISANIFRPLPPALHESAAAIDPGAAPDDEEEPFLDPAWPHLQLVYELLLRYVVSPDTDTKVAKRYVDHAFVLRLLDLFDSEDPREREYLKTVLHRIYGKFMVHRPFIRKAINNVFYRFIFETQRHNGIGELLEILGSIINGFALPMKEEHKLFLARALIPLHKPKSVAIYHQQLSYCIVQFVEKDYKLADTVIRGLLKYWPVTNCQKEVLFLGELEEVLEATQAAEFQRCMVCFN